MEEDTIYTRNPWTDDDRSLGRIKDVLFLCERTGHLAQSKKERANKPHRDIREESPSLRMISLLREMEDTRKKIAKVNLEIQRRLRDKETQDITHTDILEKRIQAINHVTSHLQTVANQKDCLIGRLQQPYVGDFIKMDVHNKKYASAIFAEIVPTLSALSSQLENIEWVNKANFDDGSLDKILDDISSTLAALELRHQTLTKVSHSTKNFNTALSPDASMMSAYVDKRDYGVGEV